MVIKPIERRDATVIWPRFFQSYFRNAQIFTDHFLSPKMSLPVGVSGSHLTHFTYGPP